MDRFDLAMEAVEVIAAIGILTAWMAGIIQTDEIVGQIVVLVAVAVIFGDAAFKVMRIKFAPQASTHESPE